MYVYIMCYLVFLVLSKCVLFIHLRLLFFSFPCPMYFQNRGYQVFREAVENVGPVMANVLRACCKLDTAREKLMALDQNVEVQKKFSWIIFLSVLQWTLVCDMDQCQPDLLEVFFPTDGFPHESKEPYCRWFLPGFADDLPWSIGWSQVILWWPGFWFLWWSELLPHQNSWPYCIWLFGTLFLPSITCLKVYISWDHP